MLASISARKGPGEMDWYLWKVFSSMSTCHPTQQESSHSEPMQRKLSAYSGRTAFVFCILSPIGCEDRLAASQPSISRRAKPYQVQTSDCFIAWVYLSWSGLAHGMAGSRQLLMAWGSLPSMMTLLRWRTSEPWTQKMMSSAMLVAWSATRSRLREIMSALRAWAAI